VPDFGALVFGPCAGAGDRPVDFGGTGVDEKSVAGAAWIARGIQPDIVFARLGDANGPGGMVIGAVPVAEIGKLLLEDNFPAANLGPASGE
jgi:hypothetical protein